MPPWDDVRCIGLETARQVDDLCVAPLKAWEQHESRLVGALLRDGACPYGMPLMIPGLAAGLFVFWERRTA